jgi:hypothetical protein
MDAGPTVAEVLATLPATLRQRPLTIADAGYRAAHREVTYARPGES